MNGEKNDERKGDRGNRGENENKNKNGIKILLSANIVSQISPYNLKTLL